MPLHELPPYLSDDPFPPFPNATSLARRGINLPSGTTLRSEEISRVCRELRELAKAAA